MKIWHGHDLGRVTVELSFDIPPETSLRILCNGIQTTAGLVDFLKKRSKDRPERAAAFLDSFLATLVAALDLRDHNLSVRAEKLGGPLDFGRPSPSWLMLKRFVEALAQEEVFQPVVARYATALPDYIVIAR